MKKTRFLVMALLSSFVLSSCPKPSDKPNLNGLSFNIYAINDFHGAVEKDISDGRMGLANMGTFFKKKGEEPNTILLDQGDSWQGSIYSNMNYGAVVDDVMSYARFDARTVGNHDFDWGVEHLKENTARSYDGYRVPVLAANVYDYNFETKQFGNTQQSDIGQPSTIINLENGLKIGVVGVIGSGQISSINSQYTLDIGFKDHVSIAKQEAIKLREAGCNFVICSIHGGQEDLLGNEMEDYVDLVLCGHTHKHQDVVENGLTYIQAGAYGRYWTEAHVKFGKNNNFTLNYEVKSYYQNQGEFTTIDPTIQGIIDTYNTQVDAQANQVLASNVDGAFASYDIAENLMAKAVMDKVISEGHDDVVLACVNQARSDLPNSTFTYKDIYQSFPFDNRVYIMEVSGNDVYRECIRFNYICKNPSFDNLISKSSKYKIAVLDYLGFHTNDNRFYDYFPSANGEYEAILSDNYRVILKNWLISNHYNEDVVLHSSDYARSVEIFNQNTIEVVN